MAGWKNEKFHIILIVLATFIALILNGYRYGVSDQAIYIPVIHKILQPDLFKNDFLFEQPSGEYNLLIPVVALLSKIFGLQWVFFIGYFLSLLGIFWVIYKLTYALSSSRGAGHLAVLFLLISIPVAGTATSTQESFFTLRTTAMPFALAVIYYFVERKYMRAGIFAAISFLIHPMTVLAPLALLFLYLLVNAHSIGWRSVGKIFGVFFLLTAPLFIRVIFFESNPRDLNFLGRASEEWLNILHSRNGYTFPSKWGDGVWKQLNMYACLFAIAMIFRVGLPLLKDSGIYKKLARFFWEHPENSRSEYSAKELRLAYAFLTSVAFLGIAYLFGEVLPLPLIVQLQVARGLYLVYYLAVVYIVCLFWEAYQTDKITTVLAAALVVTGKINLMRLGILVYLFLIAPKSLKSWIRGIGIIALAVLVFWFKKDFGIQLNVNTITLPLVLVIPFLVGGLAEALRFTIPRFSPNKPTPYLSAVFIHATILIIILVTANISSLFNKDKFLGRVYLPNLAPTNAWIELQHWAENNTKIESLFLVPPNMSGFRIYSKRGIAGDRKDGAPGLFSEKYAKEWQHRMEILNGYATFKEERFITLGKQYGASHAVTAKSHNLNFSKIYSNDQYIVYELPGGK